MKPTLPYTIHRSLVGLFGRFLAGVAACVVVAWGARSVAVDPSSRAIILELAMFVIVVILLVTVVTIIVYDSGKIVLTDEGVAVTNFVTLWSSTQAVTQWNQLQDISIKESGVLTSLLGIGELLFQSAGTETNLSLKSVPRVDYWRDYMFERMNAANPNDDAPPF